ncbi:MAG: hypothetical protein AB1391_01120 [Candidatus Micrarchaeota archaeon]
MSSTLTTSITSTTPMKFVIVKSYPESRYYEIKKRNTGLISLFLEKIGLK